MTRSCLSVCLSGLVLLQSYTCRSQDFVKGKVFSATTDSTIRGVNIFNKTSYRSTRSLADGQYSIAADESDIIIFSATGYKSDTVRVTQGMILTSYDATLEFQFISLKNVTVTNNYQNDSLSRRLYYRAVYDTQTRFFNRRGNSDGFGVSVSPLSFLSQAAKRKRVLKRRLIKEERELYIDYSFPSEWVARMTQLNGDSLSLFLYMYRPSYDFCRESDRNDMLIYINDKLKEFRKPKKIENPKKKKAF